MGKHRTSKQAKGGNGKSHADITTAPRTLFPVMLKKERKHVLDIHTKQRCQDTLGAAELLSEQCPVPPSSPQLIGYRSHVNQEPSSMV